MKHQQYRIMTVEQIIAKHPAVYERLTAQEQRIVAKTVQNMCLAWNEKPSLAVEYCKAMTPVQTETMKKFSAICLEEGVHDEYSFMCAQKVGIA